MISYHVCDKCGCPVRPSRLRNVFEFAVSLIFLPYRCKECDWRQFKFRFAGAGGLVSEEGEPVEYLPKGLRLNPRQKKKAKPEARAKPGGTARSGKSPEPEPDVKAAKAAAGADEP